MSIRRAHREQVPSTPYPAFLVLRARRVDVPLLCGVCVRAALPLPSGASAEAGPTVQTALALVARCAGCSSTVWPSPLLRRSICDMALLEGCVWVWVSGPGHAARRALARTAGRRPPDGEAVVCGAPEQSGSGGDGIGYRVVVCRGQESSLPAQCWPMGRSV
eukprot:scaffold2166_cov149-Isochrysis_galbana.AAC.4